MPGFWSPLSVPGNNFDIASCSLHLPGPPSAQKLFSLGFISATLAAELQTRLKPARMPKYVTGVTCDFSRGNVWSAPGPYGATFSYHEDYDRTWFTLIGRAPSVSASDGTAGPKAYYSFGLTTRPNDEPGDMEHLVHSVYGDLFPTPPPVLPFSGGPTLDVWFPYVLPEHERYVLSVSNVTPEIHDVAATLKDNVLHFELPSFSLSREAVAIGKIDGASFALPSPSAVPTGRVSRF